MSDTTPTVELDSREFDSDKEVGVGLLESDGPSFLSELVSTSFPGVTIETEVYDKPNSGATLPIVSGDMEGIGFMDIWNEVRTAKLEVISLNSLVIVVGSTRDNSEARIGNTDITLLVENKFMSEFKRLCVTIG